MDRPSIMQLFESHKAIISNTHVVYTSGRHGDSYVNKDAVYPYTEAISGLCAEIAEHFANHNVEVVAAPAVGGVILSQWVAHHLGVRQCHSLAVYGEKTTNGSFAFRRGYDQLLVNKRVLVVEDILTTGGSVREIIRSVRDLLGNVVGVGVLCNRGSVTAQQIGDPPDLYSLVEISQRSWPAENCPLCEKKVPIRTDIGKGREFLALKQAEAP